MRAGTAKLKKSVLIFSAFFLHSIWALENEPIEKPIATTLDNENWYQLEVLVFNRVAAWQQLQQAKRLRTQETQQVALNAPDLLLDPQPALFIDLAEQWHTPNSFYHPYNGAVLRNSQWQQASEPEPLLYLNQNELDDWYNAQSQITNPQTSNADTLEIPAEPASTDDKTSSTTPPVETLAAKYADKNSEELTAPPVYLKPAQLSQLQLNESQLSIPYNRLNRRSAYEVLYFGSWQQQFSEDNTKFQIKLNGGDQYFLADELEGNLEIELKRYFHFAFDMRLNSFAAQPTQNSENYNEPQNVAGNYLSKELFSMEPLAENLPDLYTNNQLEPLVANAPALVEPTTEMVQPLATPPTWQYSQWYNFFLEPSSIENTLTSCTLKAKQFLPHHDLEFSVALKQARRIARNKDVHYIDHPVLGVMVKITPLKLERVEIDGQGEVLSLRD